jgi:hypothetical protein
MEKSEENEWMLEEKEERGTYKFLSYYFHKTCSKTRSVSGDWKYVITGTSNSSLHDIMKLDNVGTSEAPSSSYLARPVNLHAFHIHTETKLPSV